MEQYKEIAFQCGKDCSYIMAGSYFEKLSEPYKPYTVVEGRCLPTGGMWYKLRLDN